MNIKNKKIPLVSICIISYKRPNKLSLLLECLATQSFFSLYSAEIIVVDNDKNGSAKPVIEKFIRQYPNISTTYEIEHIQGISIARNRSVGLAKGEFVAFIDDDEIADQDWLLELYRGIHRYGADAVFGPVEPILPETCPEWIRRGKFFNRPHYPDGSTLITGRTGNALVRKYWLNKFKEPFDPTLRLTGGEDSDFFHRIRSQGAKLSWIKNAIVYEFVGPERLKLKWLLMRAFRGGQGHAWRHAVRGNFIGKMSHILYRLALICFSLMMVLISFPFGRHRSVWWLRKVFSNVGQLSAYLPFRYEEYNPQRYR